MVDLNAECTDRRRKSDLPFGTNTHRERTVRSSLHETLFPQEWRYVLGGIGGFGCASAVFGRIETDRRELSLPLGCCVSIQVAGLVVPSNRNSYE